MGKFLDDELPVEISVPLFANIKFAIENKHSVFKIPTMEDFICRLTLIEGGAAWSVDGTEGTAALVFTVWEKDSEQRILNAYGDVRQKLEEELELEPIKIEAPGPIPWIISVRLPSPHYEAIANWLKPFISTMAAAIREVKSELYRNSR